MSAIEQDLQDYLVGEETDTRDEGFRVDSLDKAAWAMRKLAKLARQDREDEQVAARETARIDEWVTARLEPRQRSREYFEGLLQEYHREQLLVDEKLKTIKLPHGALKARKLPEKWEYNEAAVIAWAKETGQAETFVRVKEEANRTAVKDHVKETGEAVPGVTILAQGIRFSVEVDV